MKGPSDIIRIGLLYATLTFINSKYIPADHLMFYPLLPQGQTAKLLLHAKEVLLNMYNMTDAIPREK